MHRFTRLEIAILLRQFRDATGPIRQFCLEVDAIA
jgi:hypothetical protein